MLKRRWLAVLLLALSVIACDDDTQDAGEDVADAVADTLGPDADATSDVVADAVADTVADVPEEVEEPFECRPACSEYGELMSLCLGLSGEGLSTSSAFVLSDLSPATLERVQRALPEEVRVSVSPAHRVLIVDRLDPRVARALLGPLAVVERELPARKQGRQRVVHLPEIIVEADSRALVQRLAAEHGLRVQRAMRLPNTWVLSAPGATEAAADALRGEPGVRYAEVNLLRSIQRHNDPLYPDQWHLDTENGATLAVPGADILATEAWGVTTGDAEVIIAIHDDGVDVDHPELSTKIRYADGDRSTELVLREELDKGKGSHGTAVAGVAAASAENSAGGRGVCPDCSVMPMLIFEGTIPGSLAIDDATVADDMTTAVNAGAAVINASWGPAGGDPAVIESGQPQTTALPPVVANAFDYAEAQGRGGLGTLIVYAAGNDNQDTAHNPYLRHSTILAVAALDDQGLKSGYSSYGAQVDIAAPSSGGRTDGIIAPLPSKGAGPIFQQLAEGGVTGTQGEPYTLSFGGTSSAAPVVSGVIGLMIAANPAITAAEVRQILADTAQPVDRLGGQYDPNTGHSPYYGHGAVNAYAAVLAAQALAGTCDDTAEDVCNGVDDDCDGDVDEDCATAALCEPCELDGACTSGLCARTPNDADRRCLTPCPEGTCEAGFACQSGLCVPEDDGRCAECGEEVCNGVDDDCDGEADEEGVCAVADDGSCYFDGECAGDAICSMVNRCVDRCEEDADCTRDIDRCEVGASRYGEDIGGICYTDQVTALCMGLLCQAQPENAERFFACVERTGGDEPECGNLVGCALQHVDFDAINP